MRAYIYLVAFSRQWFHRLAADPAIPEWLTNTSVVSQTARDLPHFHLAVPNHLFNSRRSQRSRSNAFGESSRTSQSKATAERSGVWYWLVAAAQRQTTKARRAPTTPDTQFLLGQPLTPVAHSPHSPRIRSEDSLACCPSTASSDWQGEHQPYEA